MASFLLFLLFFALNNAVSAQQRGSTISRGSSLTPTGNSKWLSPSGLYAFGFFPVSTGYVLGIFFPGLRDRTVVWTADMGSPTVAGNSTLLLTSDGRFVLQQTGSQDVQIVTPTMSIASASMLDNGNFVLYNNNLTIIWESFDYPTNTLLPGQRLPQPQQLFSSASDVDYTRGLFRIKMQSDGNLVQFSVNTADTTENSYYNAVAYGEGTNYSLNLESNGHLYLFNGSSILHNFTDGHPTGNNTIYLLRIDVDGVTRLYSRSLNQEGNWDVNWETTPDRCAPKGLCGFNSFCFLTDVVAECKCLPGFREIQSGNRTAGCARNFTALGCGTKDSEEKQEMKEEENTVWDNDPYEALDAMNKQECKSACLRDCYCDVAMFKDGRCAKQKLPLRFGRRSQTDSNMALIKVSIAPSSPGVSGNSSKEIKKELRLDILGISIALVIVAALSMAISIIYIHRKYGAYKNLTDHGEARLDEDVSLRVFSYADLARATNDFGEELGKGASGTVFKGILHRSGKVVAVKRLEKECGGEKEFQTEIKTIGKTYHRNLVRLLGYCLDGPNKLLVLEYMSNGSLGDLLFNPDKRPSWEDRISIARDIARGILYLHEECETQIVHCDIKSQNILLDEHGFAKISDFGLAKLLKQDQTNTYTGIRGTKGYVAPEWHRNQPITVKADVYSFGIVLLEIICCRKSINWNLSEDEAVLEEWVYDCYEAGEIGSLVGEEIVDKRRLERVVKIGVWCIQNEPSLRPSMKKVLLMLEGTVDIPVPPNPTSVLSSAY